MTDQEGNHVTDLLAAQDALIHIAPELRVPGPIHLTHAARADQGGHFIRAEARAW